MACCSVDHSHHQVKVMSISYDISGLRSTFLFKWARKNYLQSNSWRFFWL